MSSDARSILVVEDDPGLARLIEKRLRQRSMQATCVGSGRDALAWLRSHHVELLVLDFMLPDMTAEGLLDSLDEIRPTSVIVVTGRGDEHTAVTMLRMGVSDYVVKTEHFLEDLERSIQRVLAEHEVRDLLRRKSADLEVMSERLRVAEKFEAVGRLAAGVAHDFNNFLTVVCNCAELLELSTRLGPSEREVVSDIFDAVDRARALLRQLLAFDPHEVVSSTRAMVCEPWEILGSLAPMLRELGGPRCRVATRLGDEPAAIALAAGELERIVMNLVANARDAMVDGGSIEVRVRRRELSSPAPAIGLRVGSYAVLEVEDDGPGMDETTKARVFDPFFTTKPSTIGSGLGLTSVYSIVRRCAGAVEVETSPGAGCLMRIYLPVIDEVARAR